MELEAPKVYMDDARHSCIVIRVTERKIFAIPMTAEGIDLVALPVSKFKESRSDRTGEILTPQWRVTEYPVGTAAARFLASGDVIPITKAARQQLEQLTSPLDVQPVLVKHAAIAFVNTSRRRAGRSQVAAETSTHQQAEKEKEEMETAKKPAAKAAPTKKSPKKEEAKVSGRKPGVTAFIKECLLKGMDGEEICMEISSKFPASKAGKPEIAWCRGQLKKEGAL